MPAGFVVTGLDELAKSYKMVIENYPKEVKNFMRREGTRLKDVTVAKAKSTVGEVTGNYLEGIKRGRYYVYGETGAASVRVYAAAPAYHAHLVEYGHEMVSHSGHYLGRYVHGKRVFNKAAAEFESTYEADCDKFSDKIMSDLDR